MPQSLISVVSPVYRAKSIVPELVRRIVLTLSEITEDFEIILVEDGCPENSWEAIAKECEKDSRVKGVKLSRNFGQHYAITAGLDAVSGEWIVVMDCDLQDQPEEIINLYARASEGYDVVFARRENRKDNLFKKISSKLFANFFGWLSGSKIDNSIANFGVYNKKVIDSVIKLRETSRSFSLMVQLVGFKQTSINTEHSSRYLGTTSYSLGRLLSHAISIALAYSDKPLRLTVITGMIISMGSILVTVFFLINYFSGKIQEPGFASLILSVWFLGGVIIFFLGIIGLYIGKIFEGVKNRPLYIIDKQINTSI